MIIQPSKSTLKSQVYTVENEKIHAHLDHLATEEPLEIRLANPQKTIAVTMRTPGADFELAAGFLYSEGIIHQHQDIAKMSYCVDPNLDGEQRYNIVRVELKKGTVTNLPSLERHFVTTSACGVCGKQSLESLKIQGCSAISLNQSIPFDLLYHLPQKLRSHQGIFTVTGGLHAAALFDLQGNLLKVREDVGRHNALDKLIGSAFLADELPLNDAIIMVSGRSSFEILQKCIMARCPIVCSVSAPSSLAVLLAQEFGVTLIGFLREKRFNIYSGKERIITNP